MQIEDDPEFDDWYFKDLSFSNQKNYISDDKEGKTSFGLNSLISTGIATTDDSPSCYRFWSYNLGGTYQLIATDCVFRVISYVHSETPDPDLGDINIYTIKILKHADENGQDVEVGGESLKGQSYCIKIPVGVDNLVGQTPLLYDTNLQDTPLGFDIKNVAARRVKFTLNSLISYGENYSMSDLLFIYALAEGGDSSILNCRENIWGEYVWGVRPVVDTQPFYCTGMSYIKELGDTCTISRSFMDYILRMKAFELSLRTGNYTTAKDFYNILNHKKTRRSTGGCNCGHN